MTTARAEAERAAEWLHAAHGARRVFRGVEPWPPEAGEAFAYAVQDGLLALRRAQQADTTAGYKIGLTTPRMQQLCRGEQPISGLMGGAGLRRSPARVVVGDFVHLGIESELAVRIARPLPDGPEKITRADVAAAAGEMAAAFELIEDRNADYATLDWRCLAADNSWHAGLVLGPSVPARDVADRDGVLAIDGVEVDRGSTRDVLGHPFDAIAWLANHLRGRGRRLQPGHWVSTGSIATIRFAEPGRSYRFTLNGLPPVELVVE